MSDEKMYVRKGNKVRDKISGFSGKIIFEDGTHVIIDYFCSPYSREGLRNFSIEKEDIEVEK